MRVPERLSLPLSQFPRYRMTDALAQTLEPFRQTNADYRLENTVHCLIAGAGNARGSRR